MSIQTKTSMSKIWSKLEEKGIIVGEKWKYAQSYYLYKGNRKIGYMSFLNCGVPIFHINGKCYETLRTANKW